MPSWLYLLSIHPRDICIAYYVSLACGPCDHMHYHHIGMDRLNALFHDNTHAFLISANSSRALHTPRW